ncbi:MAG: histidine kinase [Niameybacter sp.]
MLLKNMSMTKLLVLYRYSSLILTSIFYIVGGEVHRLDNTLMIILWTALTAVAGHYLYSQSKGNKQEIGIIILLEMVGNCTILMFSGGLHSPYMWYVLNTIIMAGIEFGTPYLWGIALGYIGCMVGCFYGIQAGSQKLLHIGLQELNLLVGFVLAAFMVQLLIGHLKALEQKNDEVQECLDYTLKIYKTIYLFTTQEDKQNLIQAILSHLQQVRRLPVGIYLDFMDHGETMTPNSYGIEQAELEALMSHIERSQLMKEYKTGKERVLHFEGGYLGIPVQYTYNVFGMLLVKEGCRFEELKFIAYVAGMMLKKIEMEELNEQLLIGHEQNRIANEIHDSVIQQLFGVSCKLYNMEKKAYSLGGEAMAGELKDLRATVTGTMADLRATIYGMSWNKKGKNNLIQKLESFIQTMERMHSLKIDLNVKGNLNSLSLEVQKALYRVCCEGVANGIKHGHATYIVVSFNVDTNGLSLSIQDNGQGFDYNQVVANNKLGLGVKNMEQLIHQIHGDLMIDSTPGSGTILYALIACCKSREAV